MTWNIFKTIGRNLILILLVYFIIQFFNLTQLSLTRTGFFLTIIFIILILFYILKTIFIKKGKRIFSFWTSIWQSVKQAIKENSEIKKFTTRHKNLFSFLQKRLAKDNFYGLPLTLLSLSLFYIIALFGGIIEDLINSDVIISADIRMANLLTIFRNVELTKIFFWITLLGKWQVILIFTITTIFILWLWKKQAYIIPLLISIAGSEIFTSIGKIILHRARPTVAIYVENSFSFPSGHATIAIAFYGFLTYCLIKNIKKWKYKINIFFISLITILLIGISRLYLGVHYVSDVWAGYLVGTIWLIIAISLTEYLLSKKQKIYTTYPDPKKWLVTISVIIISIGLYIIFALQYQTPATVTPLITNKITTTNIINIFKTDQLKYTETLLGNKQEPLNFIIITKNDQQLINLFKQANWLLADNVNLSSIYKIAKAVLLKESYLQAPMTPDFWDSEVHNFGFEKATAANNVRVRHHARFWKTNYITENGNNIYVGTASFDDGIKWGITHTINPDVDTEREFLFNDLQKTNIIINSTKQQLVNPELGNNFSGDPFFTNGELYILSTEKNQ